MADKIKWWVWLIIIAVVVLGWLGHMKLKQKDIGGPTHAIENFEKPTIPVVKDCSGQMYKLNIKPGRLATFGSLW
jgi:hypothetical protein